MKTLFAVGFTALLVSCTTTKETTSTPTNQNRGRSSQETTATTGAKTVQGSRTKNTNSTGMAVADKTVERDYQGELKKMYTELDMTENQVSGFEKEWKSTTDSWKRNNPNKVMNNYERIEYQDRILKTILDDSQFGSYQRWVRANEEGK